MNKEDSDFISLMIQMAWFSIQCSNLAPSPSSNGRDAFDTALITMPASGEMGVFFSGALCRSRFVHEVLIILFRVRLQIAGFRRTMAAS